MAGEHPEHAERLAELLPTIRAVAEVGQAASAELSRPLPKSGETEIGDGYPAAKVLGDFRILREIGRGGMGVVYEAEQVSLDRRVALKVLPFAAMLDERQLKRFKNEARAAASLDHANIVEVYGVGCERGVHYYAMKYVEGQTLAAVIDAMRVRGSGLGIQLNSVGNALSGVPDQQANVESADLATDHRPLATPALDTVAAALSTLRETKPRDFYRAVAQLGIQAAEALDHAHQLGVIHRDIKPANLIVESVISGQLPAVTDPQRTTDIGQRTAPKLYITDFGLAQIESDASLTMTGDILGTLRYMSPEQAEGKSAVLDHRTDIYSLGITLYELIQPFPPQTARRCSARSPPTTRRNHGKLTPPSPPIWRRSSSKRLPNTRLIGIHRPATWPTT